MSVRLLSGEDVRRALPMRDCIEAMDAVLRDLAGGGLHQPLRSVIRPPAGGPGLLGLMPAHRAGLSPAFGLKAVAVFPENPRRGLDAHQGLVLVFSGEDGRLLGLVDASAITAIRTAAVSAVATRALARSGAGRLAVLGAGVQARAHIEAIACVLPLTGVSICARRPESAQLLATEATEQHGIDCTAVDSPASALDGAEVVVTATTAREPIVRRDWLAPGAHVNAVGSSIPTTRELDGATMAAARIVVDRRESALAESGDVLLAMAEGALPRDTALIEISDVLCGTEQGRAQADDLTVFVSLGLAVEDLAAAELALATAQREGLGTQVTL